jgi:hypothetical protein
MDPPPAAARFKSRIPMTPDLVDFIKHRTESPARECN